MPRRHHSSHYFQSCRLRTLERATFSLESNSPKNARQMRKVHVIKADKGESNVPPRQIPYGERRTRRHDDHRSRNRCAESACSPACLTATAADVAKADYAETNLDGCSAASRVLC